VKNFPQAGYAEDKILLAMQRPGKKTVYGQALTKNIRN